MTDSHGEYTVRIRHIRTWKGTHPGYAIDEVRQYAGGELRIVEGKAKYSDDYDAYMIDIYRTACMALGAGQ